MIELNGKYNTAKVFTDVIDEESISQIITLCNQEFTSGEKIRMMPDVHAGAGCTIGTTMTIGTKIVPNLVGVDIGCGMETVCIKEKHIELQKLDKLIYEKIPSGFSARKKPHRYNSKIDLTKLRCLKRVNIPKAELSLGTLGGGNHFIEAAKGSHDEIYIIIHSGSRHIGLEVAKYYQNAAVESLKKTPQETVDNLIARLKFEGREKDIQSEITKIENPNSSIPPHLAYVEGHLFDDYIHDMKIIQNFAYLNRAAMMSEIINGMGLSVTEQFSTIHNYIDTENMILRKGAVSAREGEKLIIPINMRDGSIICIGKGNPDWNYSAPHGAGRLMSRSTAKQSFTVSEFKKQMGGIYTTSVNESTLDECPMAYKKMDDIINNIDETAEVINILKPIYNFKS